MVGRFLLFFFLISASAQAQSRFTVEILGAGNAPISDARVDLPHSGIAVYTNAFGKATFPVPLGAQTVRVFVLADFHQSLDTLLPIEQGGSATLQLKLNSGNLTEVTVTAEREQEDFTQLRKIEGVNIYAGKKSEVIRPDEQPVNTALNNAREVFSKVSGMNVWEGDESGVQLNIGGRGLNPNRASNFNVRQNGYDISPDALGYPESYYTPPAEAVERIEIVKGAASLQFGTQFGGLINFKMKGAPEREGYQILNRTTGGSFGLFNQFTSVGWRKNRVGVYAYGNYRRGDGWRPNSQFESGNLFAQVAFDISDVSSVKVEYTYLNYLAQQPGGLDDNMFNSNPRQSNRDRNWFGLNWNILAVHFDHRFKNGHFNLRLYGLNADRKALGFRNYRPASVDPGTERELITGDFRNAGLEARYLQRYSTAMGPWATLIGARAYAARNTSQQGLGSTGSDADFTFIESEENLQSDYKYPNDNVAFFLEQLMSLGEKWTVTPGVRFEYINSRSDGYYREIQRDLAGNIIFNQTYSGGLSRERAFVIAGVGTEYQVTPKAQIYFNATQNFRAITYSDIHIVNPSFKIDEKIEDEKGYSIDLGIRQHGASYWKYDISLFLLNYNNRIGEVAQFDTSTFRIVSYRTNIGQALIYGLESYVSYAFWHPDAVNRGASIFVNTSFVNSTYLKSALPEVVGNQVEFAPHINLKSGLEATYDSWRGRIQCTYLSEQFTDAKNDINGGAAAVTGVIPSFMVFDFGASYSTGRWQFEGGINNFTNEAYFTRRATGYPGPGIISSPGRSFYLGIQVRI
ncbi:TonB-dependent receptor family protein [Phaeocystidibacter marisrubri]|uniref:TonB-dependent receptor plug domain-containing protein n=1 Tax=Phaeocystidibacter marisrubri TaxID=1577780 RepID=A0A6L3ZEI1_9FLAO|nr:TonB-dependent receptor [Phaeocystidibacter marisrubri]KAB2816243.1 TonB-dependent receptor plug domain-containing protein [Phaeocystidibacter marisrubri]GGH68029.1 TonB-dependent receptor [Phaeocystidibacter marisrubri]